MSWGAWPVGAEKSTDRAPSIDPRSGCLMFQRFNLRVCAHLMGDVFAHGQLYVAFSRCGVLPQQPVGVRARTRRARGPLAQGRRLRRAAQLSCLRADRKKRARCLRFHPIARSRAVTKRSMRPVCADGRSFAARGAIHSGESDSRPARVPRRRPPSRRSTRVACWTRLLWEGESVA